MEKNLRYPDGLSYDDQTTSFHDLANKGMDLEMQIIESFNQGYRDHICWIVKYPTPIKVIQTKMVHGFPHITDATFASPSCCDFIGVCAAIPVVLEAKSSEGVRFSFKMLKPHQLLHLQDMIDMGGRSFVIIEMKRYATIFLLDAKVILEAIKNGEKSMDYTTLQTHGRTIESNDFTNTLNITHVLYEEVTQHVNRNQ